MTRAYHSIDDLRDLIDRHCEGSQLDTSISGLGLYRAEAPVERLRTNYWPALCVVAQGAKQVMVGDRIYQYDPLNYLVVTVGLPVTARIVTATHKQPLLSLTIDLNPSRIAEMMLETRVNEQRVRQPAALAVSPIGEDLLDAVTRLVNLLDHPEDAAVLGPLFERDEA